MIKLTGDWTNSDIKETLKALCKARNTLYLITGTNAFDLIYKDLTLESKIKIPGDYFGYVENGVPTKIQLKKGFIDYRLVLHELGHIYNDLQIDNESPSYLLVRYGIKTEEGRKVTGSYINGYMRHMGTYPPVNGYIYSHYPYHQHPKNWEDGNNELEDFGDLFLSIIDNNVLDNDSGKAINKWFKEYTISIV